MTTSTIATGPNNKASSDIFGQGCQELSSDFFDEFLTFNHHTDTIDYTNLPPSTYIDNSTSESNSLGTSLSLTDDDVKLDIQLASFNPTEFDSTPYLPSAQSQFYNDLMGRAAVSDSELLKFENISLESPQIPQPDQHTQLSLPPSPSPNAAASLRRKARMSEALSKSFKKATSSFDKALLRSPVRKPACAPNSIDEAQQTHSTEAWGKRVHQDDTFEFNFSFNENSRHLTPPLTCKASDISPNLIRTPSKPSPSFSNPPSMHRSASSVSYNTPLTTPGLDHSHSRNSSGQFSSTGPLYPVTPQNHNASGSWGCLPGSPPVNMTRNSNLYTEVEEPLWWNHASTTKIAQPAPSGFHNAQRATKTLAMQLQNGLAYSANDMSFDSASMNSGLMIQMPPAPPQSLGMGSPPMPRQQRGYFEPRRPQPQRRATHQQYAPNPKKHYQSPPPEYHRSSSSRRRRQASSDSDSSSDKSPSSSSFHIRKRRSPRTNKHAAPRTPTPGGGAVDFVNFTPQDSKKILTGVAPSGSSKTKARREKEAMDKRRKLSQAAVRAVRAAGGDIESLVEEGLFV